MEAEMALYVRIVVDILLDCWHTSRLPISLFVIWCTVAGTYLAREG